MIQFLKNKHRAFFSVAFAVSIAIVSCKKDDTNDITPEIQAQLDIASQVLNTNTELTRSTVLTGQSSKEKGSGLSNNNADDRCGAVNVTPADPLAFPKSVMLDYGAGCTDLLGISRAGNILITLQKLWEPGTTSSVEYGNYTENKVKMNGKVSLSNVSTNAGIGIQLSALNLKRTEATGAESAVESALTFKQTDGGLTFWDWKDDIYSITGSTQVALSNGQSAAMSITVPLTKSNNCAWASKGSAALVVNGVPMTVDFGNGTCDNEATVTINGVSYTIYL